MKKIFFALLVVSLCAANNVNSAGDLEARVAALEALLAGASRVGDTLVLEGMNLQIVNGLGATDGDQGSGPQVNGLGNLIVGYDEGFAYNDKSGSHNLVVGPLHSYSSYGGIVGGRHNTVSGIYATVIGGVSNRASGGNSSVSGGSYNTASGVNSSVSGGNVNTASGTEASVSGGHGSDGNRGQL